MHKAIKFKINPNLIQLSLITLLWFDLISHAPHLFATIPTTVLVQTNNIKEPPNTRYMLSISTKVLINTSKSRTPEQQVSLQHETKFENSNLLDHTAKIDGFYPLYLQHANKLLTEIKNTTNTINPLKNFLCVAHSINITNAQQWITRSNYLPLLTIGQTPSFQNDNNTIQALLNDQFEPQKTVFLPLETKTKLHITTQANATIRDSTTSPQTIKANVKTDKPTMFVIAQSFYHNWYAYIDNKPTPLWRANYAFQAIEIPKGEHQVTIKYEDFAFKLGSIISLTTLLCCLLTFIIKYKSQT